MQNHSFDFKEVNSSSPFGLIQPSFIMDFKEPIVQWLDENTAVVGYLSDDRDCSNPLEVVDGHGCIYTAQHQSPEFYSALGLDQYGSPDLELVYDHSLLRRTWIVAAAASDEFQTYCQETAGPNAQLYDGYYRRRAERFWRETKHNSYLQPTVDDFSFTENVMLQLWEQLKENRLVGDPDSVLLDCYQHSGCTWSLAGTGTQCRWDTSSAAGVWVPDTEARLEIDRRAKVYTFGFVDYRIIDGKKVWYAQIDHQHQSATKQSPEFTQWCDAFAWLEQQGKTLKTSALGSRSEQQHYVRTVARRRAANELAQSALTVYNAWLNGDVYGTVVATLNRCDHGNWHLVDSEECWGHYEADNSYSALKSSFEEVLADYRKRLEPESWPLNWSQPNTTHH